jgi:PAS domain S-box-containing protein
MNQPAICELRPTDQVLPSTTVGGQRDASEDKRVALALEELEAKLSGIISVAADAIISIDPDQRITSFTRGAESVFGYAREEVLGRDLGMLLPARTRDKYRQRVAGLVAEPDVTRQPSDGQVTIMAVRKSGEEFSAEATISKLTVGRMTLLTVAIRDVTERERIEMERMVLSEAGAVLSSSLDYRQTLRTLGELVVRHIAQVCIINMIEADATVRLLTVAHADPTKAAACESLAKLSTDPRHLLTQSALETKQPQLFGDIGSEFLESAAHDEEHVRVLRELALRSALVVPLLSGESVLGALVLASSLPHQFGVRDIGLATELARRAALALDNVRLYEAEKRATQARDEVLGIVAHDVRSPLQLILLSAQMLQRKLPKDSDAKCQEYVANIMRAVNRADQLIRDLLDVSCMEAGALTLACAVVATKPLVTNVLNSLQMLASQASIQLRLETDEELPDICADQNRLLQVLENLIGNAIKFTSPGGFITIAAIRVPGEVQFSVEDTGAGIPENSLPYVFDRFWQAEGASRRGAGLGLPICKCIIEAHGGRIWAESTLGHGTSVFFTIPTAQSTRLQRDA